MKQYEILETWHSTKYWYAEILEYIDFFGLTIKERSYTVYTLYYPIMKYYNLSHLHDFETGNLIRDPKLLQAVRAYDSKTKMQEDYDSLFPPTPS